MQVFQTELQFPWVLPTDFSSWGAISWFKLVSTVREPDLMHPIIIGPIVQWCSNAVSSITRFHNISIATPSNVINQIKTVWRKMIIQMSFDENWWYCLMAMEHMRGIDWVLCFHYYFHYYMVVCVGVEKLLLSSLNSSERGSRAQFFTWMKTDF